MSTFHEQMIARYGEREIPGEGMMRGWKRTGTWREYAWAPRPEMVGRIAAVLGARVRELTR